MACSACRKSPVIRSPSAIPSVQPRNVIVPQPSRVGQQAAPANNARGLVMGLKYVPR